MSNDAENKPQKKNFAKYAMFAAGLVFSLLFFYYAAKDVDFSKIPETLVKVDYTLYGLSILLYAFSFFVKAFQVRVMLSFKKVIRTLSVVSPIIIGYFCNNIFPAKAGEVIRTTLIARKQSLPFWTVFSATLLERSLDLVFVLLIALGTSFFISFPPEVLISIRSFVIFLIVLYAGLITLAVLAKKKKGETPRIVARLLPEKIRNKVRSTIVRLADGLWAVRKPRPLAGTFVVGLVFWIINLTGYYLRLRAFGFTVSPAVAGFVIVVVGLGVSIPSMPSYIGVYHGLIIFALGFFGIGKDEAFSFALFTHALDFVTVAILGNIAIVAEGLSLKALRKTAAAPPQGNDTEQAQQSDTE
ncbi:MAG: lysylphosphatidylglycerol synthase transmembrane domain-containing protein [Pseudomonadota bacterium]